VIPIYEPYKSEKSIAYANRALESNWISSQGEFLDSCKQLFKNTFDYKYIIFTSSGTTATHLMAEGLKYKHPNIKNLIVPNNVYSAVWNTFKMSTDYNFILLEPDVDTWNADYSLVPEDISPEDTAFLIVHNVGNVINVPKLQERFPGFMFLEDNCEGLTGKYNDIYSGSSSWLSSCSFFGNKTLTSGEGGAVVTEDEEIFEYLNSIKNQGIGKERYVTDRLGYNYRMTNIQAAILQGQLEDYDDIKTKKRNIFEWYKNHLANAHEVLQCQLVEEYTVHANWIFALKLKLHTKQDLAMYLFDRDIQTRPMFPPITYHKHYSNIDTDITKAEKLYNQCIMLPSFPVLTQNQVKYICDNIYNFFNT